LERLAARVIASHFICIPDLVLIHIQYCSIHLSLFLFYFRQLMSQLHRMGLSLSSCQAALKEDPISPSFAPLPDISFLRESGRQNSGWLF